MSPAWPVIWMRRRRANSSGNPSSAYAGLSLGEYTALHLAGAIGFEEGLQLVRQRGQYDAGSRRCQPSGMVALIGADEASAARLCDRAAEGEVLVPANFNAPGQIVVSGSRGACKRVMNAAEAEGIRATAVEGGWSVSQPAHGRRRPENEAELDRVDFAPPRAAPFTPTSPPSRMTDRGIDQGKAGAADRQPGAMGADDAMPCWRSRRDDLSSCRPAAPWLGLPSGSTGVRRWRVWGRSRP